MCYKFGCNAEYKRRLDVVSLVKNGRQVSAPEYDDNFE